jgi:hypothetical protein
MYQPLAMELGIILWRGKMNDERTKSPHGRERLHIRGDDI